MQITRKDFAQYVGKRVSITWYNKDVTTGTVLEGDGFTTKPNYYHLQDEQFETRIYVFRRSHIKAIKIL